MSEFLLISPFRGYDSSQIPWSRTEHFGSGSSRVRTEQKVSDNNFTAQSLSWRSAQPLNQGEMGSIHLLHRPGMWQLFQSKWHPRELPALCWGQLLLEGKSWDPQRVEILEFHPAGPTSTF